MWYDKLEGFALEAYRDSIKKIVEKAESELKLSRENIVVRMLRPEDLGLSNPVWTFNVSSGWNKIVDTTIGDNRFITINGVMVAETGQCVATQLKITKAGKVVRYWHIQDINFLENPVVYFDDPITVDQNTNITIEAYCTGSDNDLRLILLGCVAERSGKLVR